MGRFQKCNENENENENKNINTEDIRLPLSHPLTYIYTCIITENGENIFNASICNRFI